MKVVSEQAIRSAFSLVELIFVVAVVGLLMAVALPAIQGVRNAARLATCQSHLHQVHVALEAHLGTHRSYPDAVTLVRDLLPGLEQKAIYDAMSAGVPPQSDVRVEALVCPSDDQNTAAGDAVNYGANMGTAPQLDGINGFFLTTRHFLPLGSPPVIAESPRPSRPADIADGLSSTVAISEFLVIAPFATVHDARRAFWQIDPPLSTPIEFEQFRYQCQSLTASYQVNGSRDVTERGLYWTQLPYYMRATYHHALPPNSPSCGGPTTGIFAAGSEHPGGASSLFGDGRVTFTSDSIDRSAWAEIGSGIDVSLHTWTRTTQPW